MRFTCAQKRLLEEGRWSKCPGCGSKEAYQSFRGDWECPEDECKFFSQRRKAEVKGPKRSISQIPSDEEWASLPQQARDRGGVANVHTEINEYKISTAYFSPPLDHYETMVFNIDFSNPKLHDSLEGELEADTLQQAMANHAELVKAYGIMGTG